MGLISFDLASNRISSLTVGGGTAAHTSLASDTLHVVSGTSVVAQRAGAGAAGIWRSKRFIFAAYAGFSWLRIHGAFSGGAVARVYADGALLYTTPKIMSAAPVRLPGGRHKRWEVEIESTDRITSLTLAATTQELQ